MRLFLLFSLIIQTYSFYLKAAPGHNSEHAEILTDPIHGTYHLFLMYSGHHICSIGAKDSQILFVDDVCKEATITIQREHWLFSIDHKDQPYGTITVKLLLSDGSTLSEEILGRCPGTNTKGRCLELTHTENGGGGGGGAGDSGGGGGSSGGWTYPAIAGGFIFVMFLVIYIYY